MASTWRQTWSWPHFRPSNLISSEMPSQFEIECDRRSFLMMYIGCNRQQAVALHWPPITSFHLWEAQRLEPAWTDITWTDNIGRKNGDRRRHRVHITTFKVRTPSANSVTLTAPLSIGIQEKWNSNSLLLAWHITWSNSDSGIKILDNTPTGLSLQVMKTKDSTVIWSSTGSVTYASETDNSDFSDWDDCSSPDTESGRWIGTKASVGFRWAQGDSATWEEWRKAEKKWVSAGFGYNQTQKEGDKEARRSWMVDWENGELVRIKFHDQILTGFQEVPLLCKKNSQVTTTRVTCARGDWKSRPCLHCSSEVPLWVEFHWILLRGGETVSSPDIVIIPFRRSKENMLKALGSCVSSSPLRT